MSDGTPLYDRIIAHGQDSVAGPELTRKVWDPTPWVIDVYVGHYNEDTEYDIRHWCLEHFGKESWPIHDKPADWYRGGATVNGWTWFGFKTEDMMKQFMEAWPDNVKGIEVVD